MTDYCVPSHIDATIDEILEKEKLEYVEMEEFREDELKDPHRKIKMELISIVAAYQDPVCCNRIFRDYEEMNGCPLDPSEFGFKSFTSMMRVFSDKFNYHQDGIKTSYTAKTTERSAHLQDLIKNQVTIEEKRRRDMRRSRSYSRNGRRSSYGAGIYYSQKFVPLLMDDRSAEDRLAESLASFGRSWGAAMEEREGLDWAGRKSRLESSSSDEDGGVQEVRYLRSRSVPSPRPMLNVYDDPRARDDDDLDDCTNPFRTDNNVRVRDLVIKYGELDDTGRKGMALIQVAEKFEKDYRQPLGGIPGLTEEKLMTKMSVVKTVEWIVERMGDNHAYVIVPEETLKKAHEVGPGTSTAPRPGPAEKPKSSGVSPAAKRMFGFALKGALSVNQRQNGTRERNLQEREMIYGEIVAGFDGDPVMTEMEAPPPSPPKKTTPRRHHFDRAVMMSLSDHDSLDAKVESLAGSMRILRTQTSPASSSSHSSHSGRRPFGRPLARITPPVSSSNMFSSGFGGAKAVPSFGTFKSGPPPASIAAADKDDDDDCVVLEPSQSSLASKLPQMSFKPVPVFARKPIGVMTANGAIPSFGTSSQSVPYNPAPTPPPRTIPTFGTTSASSPFQSAFGGAPKKMVEVIGSSDEKKEEEAKAEEVLGATIQFIGRLRGGEIVYMKEIDNTPIEDIIANNPDFFDIDENDDHIHLLHRDVDPKLLMYDGQQLGEMVAEKKTTPAPEPSRAGAFSRPSPPTFGRPSPSTAAAAPPAIDPKPTFGSMSVPSFAKTREIPTFGTVNRLAVPTFGNVEKREEKKEEMPSEPLRTESRPIPTFGAPSRAVEKPVERAAPTPSFSAPSPKPLEGMPSFGTKSRELERPDSALSNGSHDPKKVPTFDTVPTRAVERAESVVSDKTEDGTQQSKYSSASSTISSSAEDEDPMRKRLSSVDSESFHSSEETMEKKEEMEDPYTFHSHPNLRSLCKKSSIALDSVRPGETIRAAIITSFNPNLIVLAMVEANMHDNLKTIMHDLRRSYVDVEPIGDGVRLGQFAVAINGECIVRVVVLRKTETIEGKKAYECACLDFNALITVEGSYLHPLFEKFNVTAIRATTFVARINKVADLTARGHRAVKLVAKSEDEDDDIKKPLPVVFHGKDEATGELVVDVAMTFGKEYVWMGETLPRLIGNSTMVACSDMINPNIEHAIEFAVKRNMDGYQMEKKKREEKVEKKSVEEAYERADTPNEADLTPTLRCESEEKVGVHKGETIVFSQKEEGELDTSLDDSFTSERTTVDRHAAGDFVREVKSEIPDEFVIVAPVAPKAIINVESMTSLIRQLNANGESLEVEVIKSMCKALVLTANKMLSNQGERGALIANAEALEEIDML